MRLYTEEVSTSSPVLVVSKKKSPWITRLKDGLKSYGYDSFSSTALTASDTEWAYIVIYDDKQAVNKLLSTRGNRVKTIIITTCDRPFFHRIARTIHDNHLRHIKVVNIDHHHVAEKDQSMEKTLWFLFADTKEIALDLQKTLKKTHSIPSPRIIKPRVIQRKLLRFAIGAFITMQLFFLIPLAGGAYFLYLGGKSLARYQIDNAARYTATARPLVSLANTSYRFSRPIVSFFYLAIFTDDALIVENTALSFLTAATAAAQNAQHIVPLVLQTEKDKNEKNELEGRVTALKREVRTALKDTRALSAKLNLYQNGYATRLTSQLDKVSVELAQAEIFLDHIDRLIGGTTDKKYLILFQNNMEIRPGGGFIGSYAVLTFADYTLKEFAVEDVYEADGQLKEHIPPPNPIKTYLNQPHWFLRDSNFSPDFPENFKTAEMFLEKERGIKDLRGGAAITTTAISNLLGAIGELYLPDYEETITADNFYIKTQMQAESGFFPGSKQKKNFLGSVVTALLAKFETLPLHTVLSSIKSSLEEKHITMFLDNETLQKEIEILGFSGKLFAPSCTAQPCITETIYPVDANLGVNKANFFIKRLINISVNFLDEGTVEHTLTEVFKNESTENIYPGGIYKNYLQIYLSNDAQLKRLTLSGQPIPFDQETRGAFKIVGFLLEVPPRETRQIKLIFHSGKKLNPGINNYELIVQKQTGTLNSDFILSLTAPPTIAVNSQNFSTLANKGSLVYNTSLSRDRIFLIKVIKQ